MTDDSLGPGDGPNPWKAYWREALPLRLNSLWLATRWPLLGAAWLIVFGLGWVGFYEYDLKRQIQNPPIDETFYRAIELFALQGGEREGELPGTLQFARFAAPVVGLLTLVGTLLVVLREQHDLARALLFRRWVLICGIGDVGAALVLAYRARGRAVVAIDQLADSPLVRQCRDAGAVVIIGDAADPATLVHAGVHRAQEVVVTCGDDAVNARVANLADRLAGPRPAADRICAQHAVDPYLWRDLVRQPLTSQLGFRRVFFNLYDAGARALLAEFPFPPDGAHEPRLVIVGLGRLGESLAMRAARRWRDRRTSDSSLLTVTIVDRDAERKCELLKLHFPRITSAARLEPVTCDVRSADFESFEFLRNGSQDALGVAVCLDDDTLSLTAARLILQSNLNANVVLRLRQADGLIEILRGPHRGLGTEPWQTFTLLTAACTPDVVHGGASEETLARLIHEAYVDQQRQLGETITTNPSTVPWNDLPSDLQHSNRDQARHIGQKLASIGQWYVASPEWDIKNEQFSKTETKLLAIAEHDRWVRERLAQGWRYGPERDTDGKKSPYLGPWGDLPQPDERGVDVRDYDRNTIRRLPDFLSRAGFRMQRL